MKKPVILMILDGFGIAPEKGNAIKAAKKPNIDKLFASNPLTQIGASGMDVGLPDGQMGNSEVGHTNMGAGRIVYQELTRITKTINEDKLKDNEAIVSTVFLNLLRKRVLRMFTFTHSLTVVMFRLQVPLNMLTSFLTSSKKSA